MPADGDTGGRQLVLLACPPDALAVRPASITSPSPRGLSGPRTHSVSLMSPADQGRRLDVLG